MRKDFRERLAKEYRYAVTRMQQETQPAKKLFYFSIFFGEAQRMLNLEWDRDLVLTFMVTQQVYTQINAATQTSSLLQLPIDGSIIYEQLTSISFDLAACFEKTENKVNKEELYKTLGRLAEINYLATGNGSYLYEKGLIKL
jgi:hypothetical protein